MNTFTVTGEIRCSRGEPPSPSCKCCKGRPHAYYRWVGLNLPESFFKPYESASIDNWISRVIDLEASEGRRVKITVELLPKGRKS